MNMIKSKLQTLREAAGLSRRQLAKKIGVSPQYLALCERGRFIKPGIHTKSKLAEFFKCQISDLEEWDDESL